MTVFACRPQSSYRDNDIFWIFPVVLCHAFCMWHWPICKNLDLSFIWGHHHLNLGDDRPINRLLHYLLHRTDETQQGRNSCPRLQMLQFLAFNLDSIMPCFLRSISLASLFGNNNGSPYPLTPPLNFQFTFYEGDRRQANMMHDCSLLSPQFNDEFTFFRSRF